MSWLSYPHLPARENAKHNFMNNIAYFSGLYFTTATPKIVAMPYLAHISLLVRDYDEAIAFYSRLGFELVEDTFIPEQQKRWVIIRPPPTQPLFSSSSSAERQTQEPTATPALDCSSHGATILLAQPSNAEQEVFVGNQTGGRVFLFLATDDFERDFKRLSDAGVDWVRQPKIEVYGKVAVWKDLYGNLWDLIQYH
jgi:catechol 2,3-dioxygenase-like lactoylglutathione lyase family enzyme